MKMEYNLKLIHSKKSVTDFGELPVSGVFVLADVKTTSWLDLFCGGVWAVSVQTPINPISFSLEFLLQIDAGPED